MQFAKRRQQGKGEMRHQLISKLTEAKRLEWVKEEGQRIYKNFKYLQDINNSYKANKHQFTASTLKILSQVGLVASLNRCKLQCSDSTEL